MKPDEKIVETISINLSIDEIKEAVKPLIQKKMGNYITFPKDAKWVIDAIMVEDKRCSGQIWDDGLLPERFDGLKIMIESVRPTYESVKRKRR